METSRWVIVFPLPDYIRTVVGAAYWRVTGRDLPASHLHVSLVFPFYLHDGHGLEWLEEVVAGLHFIPVKARLGPVGVYRQGDKQILHMIVYPQESFRRLHGELLARLRGGVVFDTSVFADGQLPPYEAHVSLDYVFDGDRTTLGGLEAEQIEGFFTVERLRVARLSDEGFELV